MLAINTFGGTRLDLAEKFLAVLAALPHLAGPMAFIGQLLADTAVEDGIMLGAVEQAGALADHLAFGVAGGAGEGGVDRNEVEVAVQHRHRLVHAAQYRNRDPAFALGFTYQSDVACGAGNPSDLAVGAVFHCSPARAHPQPFAVRVENAVFRNEQFGLPAEMLAQLRLHLRQVVGVDAVVAVDGGQHLQVGTMTARIDPDPADVPRFQVVVPVLFGRRPQRELQAVLAVAQLMGMVLVGAESAAPCDKQHDSKHASQRERCDQLQFR